MSWLEKVSEKLGIIEEDYEDDGIEEKDEEKESEELPVPEQRQDLTDSGESSEFLPHQQFQNEEVMPETSGPRLYVRDEEVLKKQTSKKNNMSQFTMQIRSGDTAGGKKKSMFGGKAANNIDAVSALAQALNIMRVCPESFDDSQKIADCLQQGQPVIVNYEETDGILANRIKDFISGVTYALGGSVKDLGTQVVLCSPKMVDVGVFSNSVE